MSDIEITVTSKDAVDYSSIKGKTEALSRDIADAGKRAGKEFGENFTRDAAGRLHDHRGRFASDGEKSGSGMAGGMVRGAVGVLSGNSKAISDLVSNPYKLGSVAAVGAMAAIPLGAVTAGAALLGLGGGMLALAGFAVKGSADVKNAAADLSASWSGAMQKIGLGTEKHFIGALDTLNRTATKLTPVLSNMAQGVAPHIQNLAVGVDGLATRSMPGLERAVAASGDVMDDFAAKLPETGDAISDLGDDLADSAEGGGKALNATMTLLNVTIGQAGNTLRLASQGFNEYVDGIGRFTGAGSLLAGKMSETKEATDGAADSTVKLVHASKEAADVAKYEAEQLQEVTDKMTGLARAELGTRDASRGFQEAISDATTSVQRNGRTLDIATAAGRRNQNALDGIASATFRKVEADVRAGRSGSAVAGTMNAGRAAFINAAVAMGMARGAAANLANALGMIPRNVTTYVRVVGVDTAGVRAKQFARAGYGVGGQAHGGITPARAASGGVRNGLTLVGEDGPELADLPAGTMVHPAGRTRAMLEQGGGGGGSMQIELSARPGGSRELLDVLINALQYAVRSRAGGNVQRLLGTG